MNDDVMLFVVMGWNATTGWTEAGTIGKYDMYWVRDSICPTAVREYRLKSLRRLEVTSFM